MKVIYSSQHMAHNPEFEIYDGVLTPYAETPARLESIVAALQNQPAFEFIEPQDFGTEYIAMVHQQNYMDFIKTKSEQLPISQPLYPSYFITDTYAPLTNGTYKAALASANIAMTGAELVHSGEKYAYSMCRPPGHHAEYKSMGGYCYFNNAAIAANYLSQFGRVAILDIDFHHGNGTQHIFYDRADVLYVSIHGDPAEVYPYSSGFANERGRGDGEGFTVNYPLPSGTTNQTYEAVLIKALASVQQYKPNFVIVSAGFDTFEHDPICNFKLTVPFYKTIAQHIAALQLPTLIVQEGGYDVANLGTIARTFLHGFEES